MVSIAILTFNEAANISSCLESIRWCDNIVVVDSFSTDRTREIAASLGATVVSNGFETFAQQRNFAMSLTCVRHDWVFHLDADERFTPALQAEVLEAARAGTKSGYYVPSKMMLFGRWLKRAAGYPVYQVRLVNRHEMEFIQRGHGQIEGPGSKGFGYLRQPYIHYSFNTGFEQWATKHNRYSTTEASQEYSADAPPLRNALVADKTARRRALRKLASRLPGRPLIKFAYLYLLQGGILEGYPGLTYCALQSIYEYLIVLKRYELRIRASGRLP